MRPSWRTAVALLVAALATACTTAIDGTARPAPTLRPHPLTGPAIKQVLLDDAALSKMLNQTFEAMSIVPPRFGGPEMLSPGVELVSPANCAGVTSMMITKVYGSADVVNVARESWWNLHAAKVMSASEGVVALSSAAGAGALFQKFSQQWRDCDGTTVTSDSPSIIIDRPGMSFSDKVSDVRVADSVVAATLVEKQLTPAPPGEPIPKARAVGVRGNCLVEVDVAFFGAVDPSYPGSHDVDTTAVNIAHVMMDKVSELS
ncbi:sensor domain-containing protein [Mycobacterium sp. IS-1264]|uniref:sensor domain-containing protein n=1 Tax=Mycobacterium sp. IS-1264 TaxID=1834158 RepID=UPI00096CB1B1|nr:sensor domain-containing protein [Mycobacterium sp. IS-1264]OMC40096.1 hypothetical protein A5744_01635 [Mycobacterium sp. IS-1264]